MVTGRQLGNVNDGEYASKVNPSKMRYLHNEESFRKLWMEVGEKTSTEWDVDVREEKVGIYSGERGENHEKEGGRHLVFLMTRQK